MTRFARLIRHYYLVVPFGAAAAVIWANTASEGYFRFVHASSFSVNQVGMALFFAFITQELLEALLPGGALHHWRLVLAPVIGAVGGVLGAVTVYRFYLGGVGEIMLREAWPAAVAVDIVFCYCIARALFRHRGAILFTLMLAVATDVVVLPIVTVSYAFAQPHAWGYLVILAAVVMAMVMRRSGVRSVWAYVLGCGAVSWWGFFLTGMYPSLALVLIVPFIPHAARETDLLGPGSARRHGSHLERKLEYPVHVILGLFALINAGVMVQSFEPGTWAIPIAALAGRSLGIMIFVAAALLVGFRLPRFMAGRDLIVVAIIASVGFTFALFVGTAVLPIGSLLTQTKMGALSTVGGALIAAIAAWLLKVGEFAPRPAPQHAHAHDHAPHAS